MQVKPFQHRSEVLRVARTWINTPWAHQGHVKGQSCDCISLVVETLKETGWKPAVEFQYPPGYPRLPRDTDNLIERMVRETFEEIKPEQAKPADIALIGWGKRSIPIHLAFFGDYLDKHEHLSIIHALIIAPQLGSHFAGHVKEHIFAGEWPERVRGYFRVPGII